MVGVLTLVIPEDVEGSSKDVDGVTHGSAGCRLTGFSEKYTGGSSPASIDGDGVSLSVTWNNTFINIYILQKVNDVMNVKPSLPTFIPIG